MTSRSKKKNKTKNSKKSPATAVTTTPPTAAATPATPAGLAVDPVVSQDKPIERGNKEKKEEKIEIKQGKENQDPNQEVEAKKESLSNEEEDEVEWQKARGRSKKKGTTKIKLSVQKLDVKSDATNDSTTSCGSSQVAKDKPAPWKLENEKPKTGSSVPSFTSNQLNELHKFEPTDFMNTENYDKLTAECPFCKEKEGGECRSFSFWKLEKFDQPKRTVHVCYYDANMVLQSDDIKNLPLFKDGMFVAHVAKNPDKRYILKRRLLGGGQIESSRFTTEVSAYGNLDNVEGICQMATAKTDELKHSKLILELAPGGNLRHFLQVCYKEEYEFDHIEFMKKILEAVRNIHAKNMTHRDIKDINVVVDIVDGVPVPKLIDFDIAKGDVNHALHTHESRTKTLTENIGTPFWQCPDLKRVESKNDGKPKNHLQTKNDAQTKNDGEAKVNWKEVDIWNCGRVLQFIMGFPEKIKTFDYDSHFVHDTEKQNDLTGLTKYLNSRNNLVVQGLMPMVDQVLYTMTFPKDKGNERPTADEVLLDPLFLPLNKKIDLLEELQNVSKPNFFSGIEYHVKLYPKWEERMSHLGWKVPKKSVEIGKISCIMMRNMVAHRHDNKKTDEHPSTPFKKFKCPVTEITRVFPLLLPFAFYSLAISQDAAAIERLERQDIVIPKRIANFRLRCIHKLMGALRKPDAKDLIQEWGVLYF